MSPILKFFVFAGILFFGLAGIGFYWTFYTSLPDYAAAIELNGLNEPADIHWDSYGVPHIYARSEDDLYYTIGYIHAQERLWQMTLSQITAEGRFAEFLGEELVPFDKYQRTLGLWETAKKIEEEAPDSLLLLLQRYADGVNDYVEANHTNLPLEFTLLGADPVPWTPAHSIAMSRMMAWDQNMHWWNELAFAYLGERLETQKMQELFPVYDDSYPTTLNDEESRGFASGVLPMLETEKRLRSMLSKQGAPFGSNAWAVSGSRTESGRPLLAGDPHMGLSIPGFWFEAVYTTPDQSISGATIPGSPFMVLGRNNHLAWTITNMMADDTDFFVERQAANDTTRYVTAAGTLEAPETTQEFQIREEIIRIKDADDLLFNIRSTRHGPVVSDIHPDTSLTGNKMITLRWMGHEVSHELWALYKMNTAVNITEFENAARMFKSPAMNFIYADNEDNIALFAAGSLPVRDYNPLLFRPGWDADYSWRGTLPFDALPHVINPENGYVSHANNKMHTDSYPHYIGSFWEPPSRIMRINFLLENRENADAAFMEDMQFDAFSEHTREIIEQILPVLRSSDENGEFNSILPYLENWDHEYQPASVAATIFDLFFIKLTENILLDDIGEEAYRALTAMESLPVLIVSRMLREESSFFNISSTPETERRNDIIRMSMRETVTELTEKYGPEPVEWRWENLHTITFRPPLLGEMSEQPDVPQVLKKIVLNLMNRGPFPAYGNGMTINKGQYRWDNPFKMTMGASIRRIIDFSEPGRSRSVLATGQSGNPMSAHYGNQTDLWLGGHYRYLYRDSTFFEQSSFQSMRLHPAE